MAEAEEQFLALNLDDTLTWQEQLLTIPHAWVDLTHVEGKKFYAAPQAQAAIESALDAHGSIPLCFWGAGDYHYVTYSRLRLLRHPVTLVLFDQHHDSAPIQQEVMTCGNWVRHALELPWVQRVVWIGGAQPELWNFRAHPRLLWVRRPTPPAPFARWVARAIPTASIYLSVDKDVLAPSDGMTNWGAGDLPLKNLIAWVKSLLQHRRLLGADVGGEWTVPTSRIVLSPQDRLAIRKNQAANLQILDALRPSLHRRDAQRSGRTG